VPTADTDVCQHVILMCDNRRHWCVPTCDTDLYQGMTVVAEVAQDWEASGKHHGHTYHACIPGACPLSLLLSFQWAAWTGRVSSKQFLLGTSVFHEVQPSITGGGLQLVLPEWNCFDTSVVLDVCPTQSLCAVRMAGRLLLPVNDMHFCVPPSKCTITLPLAHDPSPPCARPSSSTRPVPCGTRFQ